MPPQQLKMTIALCRNSLMMVLLIMFSTLPVWAGTGHINFEQGTWKEIQAKAAKENKPIFIDAYTTWCGPCKWMSANVFTDSAVADYYNTHFINAKIDMEKGEGLQLAKNYGVKAYPTLLYVDANGKQLHRTCGSEEAKSFLANGKTAVDPDKRLSHYATIFEAGKYGTPFVMEYLDLLSKACTDELTRVAEKYLSTQDDTQLATLDNWHVMQKYVTDVSSAQFQFLLSHREIYNKLTDKREVDKKITSTYFDAIRRLVRLAGDDEAQYKKFKADIIVYAAELAPSLVSQLDVAWYKQQKQWDKYAAAVINDQEKFPTDDHTKLNGFAWDFYEHVDDPTLLDLALGWSKTSISMRDASYNEDTYAWLLFKTGRKDEAVKTEEKALKMATDAGEDTLPFKEALEKFKTALP